MSADSSSSHAPEPAAAPPRYRGLFGAAVSGLITMAFMLVIAAVGGAVIWWLTGAVDPAVQLVLRYVWFGMAAGGAVALCWLASGTECDRLLRERRHTKGKTYGWLGFVVGLILAGFLCSDWPRTTRPPSRGTPSLGKPSRSPVPRSMAAATTWPDSAARWCSSTSGPTWCGPCVAELPNVRAAYEKYHDKGLEVVAISLDNETAPWPNSENES